MFREQEQKQVLPERSEFTCNGLSGLSWICSTLAEFHPLPASRLSTQESTYKKKLAFTLAEVLITLGIIGVVAAMTLPTLVQKYQERATVSKVKKFYSMMSQALIMAIKDNGEVNEWDFYERDEEDNPMTDKFVSYLKPYLKISKDCGGKSDCIANEYFTLKGTSWTHATGHAPYDTHKRYYKMILADGSALWFRENINGAGSECTDTDSGVQNVCAIFWYDTNGKLPLNTFGKDTFYFLIQKNRIVLPNSDDCNIEEEGWGCSKYILEHDDMKYLSE